MELGMPGNLAAAYKSRCQRARVVTEAWARCNLYCARCDSPRLEPTAPNTRVADFICPRCGAAFQLKSQSRPFSHRVIDSAYEPMQRAVREGRSPHFLILQYEASAWRVLNLTLLPSFALTTSCLEKRKPLSLSAHRSGWVGCNILLFRIPVDARILVISDGRPCAVTAVRQRFRLLEPLERVGHEARGWTLDVLNIVRSLKKPEFCLTEIYARVEELQALHPDNLHIREKVRQQMQRLRDMGLVKFVGRGTYALKF